MGRFVMVSGKVVRFDEVRGYGFVAPEGGGEDVFIHVNDLTFDKRLLTPGTLVEFTVEEGDRGPKASHVRMLGSPEPSRPMDNDLCDVLSTKKFIGEVTETLLSAAPTMSAQQILQARQGLVVKAREHGWVED
jgi:CspA family cold shock protein